ncbi:glutamine amidotransferase [Candidatus Dojkabacteria bacterium]|nr:glutamine amidotransferase [Candidatus Dojkabacteria bacterium]
MDLRITHLYPEEMNLYGDLGNVIVLRRRAEARDIKVKIKSVKVGDKLKPNETDIYFFGGGQDRQQADIAPDLIEKKKDALLKDLRTGTVALCICGGYQLLGKYYLTGESRKAEGVGFFPIETVAPGPNVQQRCIGNISTRIIHEKTKEEIGKYYTYGGVKGKNLFTLVGFENHAGRTRIVGKDEMKLAKVIKGIGDNEDRISDGLRYKNAFGTYLHGSFLPKNPHIADLLISLAMKNKYGRKFGQLETLDDSLEWQAHENAL